MFLDYLQSNPGSGAMFSHYLQATWGKNENENALAFKGFKNSVNGILGENDLDGIVTWNHGKILVAPSVRCTLIYNLFSGEKGELKSSRW